MKCWKWTKLNLILQKSYKTYQNKFFWGINIKLKNWACYESLKHTKISFLKPSKCLIQVLIIVLEKLYFFLERLWIIMWIRESKVVKMWVPEVLVFRFNVTSIYLYSCVWRSHINYHFLNTAPHPLGLTSISKILYFIAKKFWLDKSHFCYSIL